MPVETGPITWARSWAPYELQMGSLMLFQFTPGAIVLSTKIIRVRLEFLEFESRSS
jgi:hypothetical protein